MKKVYVAPKLEIEEFVPEAVFTASSGGGGIGPDHPWWDDVKNGNGGNNTNCWSPIKNPANVNDSGQGYVFCNSWG